MSETEELSLLRRKLARERAAREAAESLLEAKARELHERNLELRRSNEELERFAYAASHDLRAPLRTIAGFSDLLQRKESGAMSDAGREFLELIHEAIGQMDNLIEDLLQFSRANRIEMAFEPVALSQVVDDACDRLRAMLDQQGAVIDMGTLPQVSGHAGLLTRLFQNLISNGCNFARPDVSPVLRISATEEDAQVCVHVADNGIGIEPAYQDKIFQMFTRLHSADEYPGSGIGLALCARIVERHTGRLDVVSEAGQGATFRVWLPKATGDQVPASQ